MTANESHLHGFFTFTRAELSPAPNPVLTTRVNASVTPVHGTLFEQQPYLLKPTSNAPATPLEKPLELADLLL